MPPLPIKTKIPQRAGLIQLFFIGYCDMADLIAVTYKQAKIQYLCGFKTRRGERKESYFLYPR